MAMFDFVMIIRNDKLVVGKSGQSFQRWTVSFWME